MGIQALPAVVTDICDLALLGLYGGFNAVIYLVFLIAVCPTMNQTPSAVVAIRYLALHGLYDGFTAVVYSVLPIPHSTEVR